MKNVMYPIYSTDPVVFEDEALMRDTYRYLFEWADWKKISLKCVHEHALTEQDDKNFPPGTDTVPYLKYVLEFVEDNQ